MPATCTGRDDLCPSRLVVDRIEQALRNLYRQVVFFGERAKRTGHSAARGVEHSGLSSRHTFRKCCHERGIQNRLGMAMRVDRNRYRTILELECVWFLPQ